MKILFLIFLGILSIVLVIRLNEDRFIFFPVKGAPSVLDQVAGHEDVFLHTIDGKKLHGWFFPASSAAPVVLFLHGNAGNIGHRWEKIRIFHELGVAVFIFDYRGYGQSEGEPSEAGIYKDTDAAYAYLMGRDIAAEKIIVYGESLGGAVAIDLASKRPVKAIIVENTFTSVPAMVRRTMPFIPGFVLATRLDSLSKIKKIQSPKLIFHSLNDEIIPYEMGKALFSTATDPKTFVQLRGGHNTAFVDDSENYRRSLRKFISNLQ